jgi:hypothetical protein
MIDLSVQQLIYGLDWGIGVRFLAETVDFSFLYGIQTGSDIYPVTYSLGTGVFSLGIKAVGALSWQPTSI